MNHPWLARIVPVNVTDPAFGRLEPTQRNLPRNTALVSMLKQ